MLRLRIITAVALLAVLLPCIASEARWPFAAFSLLLASAGMWEWARLSGWHGRAALVAAAPVPLWGIWWWSQGLQSLPPQLWWVLALLWCVLLPLALRRGPQAWAALTPVARWFIGCCVLAGTWHALLELRAIGIHFLLSTLALVWVSDIAAYFTGRAFGRRRLAPTISPGKTWEGVLGAVVCTAGLALWWMTQETALSLDSPSLWRSAVQQWGVPVAAVVVALVVSLGIAGDLFESLIKRGMGVKDSSALLPGHGGVLDRVDAILPVLPVALLVAKQGAPWLG